MKAKELALILMKHPEREVILQKDAEGNDHSPLSDYWFGAYLPDTSWYGTAGLEELTPELKNQGYSEEDVIKNGIKSIFLVPVN